MTMLYGELFALTAACLWGTVPILIRRGLAHSTISVAVVWGLLVSLPLLALVFVFHPRSVLEAVAPQAAVWFVAVGILGPCIGRVFNFIGVARLGAARATPLVNIAPLFTTILAVVFLHEQITLKIFLGMLSIVAGVAFLTGQQRT
jgi:drug/metabolite transporter (DMT)-like permease